jgi:hypothetical protein
VPFSWSGLLASISNGQWLSTVHAGSNLGFIPNAYVLLKSHQTTGDYHSDMNFKVLSCA